MLLELPHTRDCLVCGTQNPQGLHLSLYVDTETGAITTTFTPTANHIGFQNILHGGILMTVADEAMGWASIWSSKRICLAAEFTSRFRHPARPHDPLTITATVTSKRPRLLETRCTITNSSGIVISQSNAKFIPLPESDYPTLLTSLLPHPNTSTAMSILHR